MCKTSTSKTINTEERNLKNSKLMERYHVPGLEEPSIVNLPILPGLINRFKAIPIKFLVVLF